MWHLSDADMGQTLSMHEQARAARNHQLADLLRNRLTASGVTIFDKTGSWRASDGRSGCIPRKGGEASVASSEAGAEGAVAKASQDAQIKQLIQIRETARSMKDFAKSDKLRDELAALGIDVFDKDKMWRSQDGRCGVIIGYRGDAGPSDIEISTLVVQREKARKAADYATADLIRSELKEVGVEIFDRDKTWRCRDGRCGPVPSWDHMEGNVNPSLALPGHCRVSSDVQGQIIQLALNNAADPVTAARTLHLLQSVAGPKKCVQVCSAPAPSGPEFQESLAFCSQCKATGRTPTDAEIQWLVEAREQMRFKKAYANADTLRESMKGLGIELVEKEKRWSCNDGRQGSIPMFGSFAV